MRSVGEVIRWVLSMLMLVGGGLLIFAGAVLATSGYDPTFGDTLAGVGLGCLFLGLVLVAVGGLILHGLVASPPERPTRYLRSRERPAVAQARLDEAAKAVADGAYRDAFSPMYDESYEADRRGDREALEVLLALANAIENAPNAHR